LALAAGWLADRVGSKRLLIVYLLGCAAACVMVYAASTLPLLFVTMFVMGCFASIYHPAGLALISHETHPADRGRALGWHGILGSLGISGAPLIVAAALHGSTFTWREYYLCLALPGVFLAVSLAMLLRAQPPLDPHTHRHGRPADDARWGAFFLLVAVGTLAGFVYAALMQFLPRYLSEVDSAWIGSDPTTRRLLFTGLALFFGILGQALAGRMCRPGRLEKMLVWIMLGQVPCLIWMAQAQGTQRVAATCALMLIHFANQPVYNSLIAQYVPAARRSLGYGFSNFMGFGLGALGSAAAGQLLQRGGAAHGAAWTYGTLAAVVGVAGVLAIGLCRRCRT
jgi:MFS family permease